MNARRNGVDDSQQIITISNATQKVLHDADGGALRTWMILLAALVPVALGILYAVGYVQDSAVKAVEVHAEHPHKGVVSERRYERDLDRLEKKVDKLDGKMDLILTRLQ